MAEYTEDDLYDMDDDALEEAYNKAKADLVNEDFLDQKQSEDNFDDATDAEEPMDNELEQSDDSEDSDNNADMDDEDNESYDDEPSDKTESETEDDDSSDNDGSNEEDTSNSDDNLSEESVQPEQKKSKFKANGLEYEFTQEEIMKAFPTVFGQAMDYTKKMQALKPWRKTIDAIEQANLTNEDLNLAIDVLKGDKEAIGELLKRTGVDALELEVEDNNYVPKDYGRDEATLELNDVINKISADPEYSKTQRVLGEEWDDASWNALATNPRNIEAFHVDVKTGVFDKVQPIANKLKLYDGGTKSDLDYYKEAGRIYYANLEAEKVRQTTPKVTDVQKEAEINRVKAEEIKRANVRQKAAKRKSAAPTKTGAGANSGGVTDYLHASDEDFEQWYESNVQNRY